MRGMRRENRHVVPFSALGHLAVVDGAPYVADGGEAAISVRDETGGRVREIVLPDVEIDADAAWSDLVGRVHREEVRNHAIYAGVVDWISHDDVPQIGALLADDGGRLWVQTYDPGRDSMWGRRHVLRAGPGGEWRVVRPDDGAWIATVRMPPGVTPLTVHDDRLVCIARDELDVQRVVVHPLERGG